MREEDVLKQALAPHSYNDEDATVSIVDINRVFQWNDSKKVSLLEALKHRKDAVLSAASDDAEGEMM